MMPHLNRIHLKSRLTHSLKLWSYFAIKRESNNQDPAEQTISKPLTDFIAFAKCHAYIILKDIVFHYCADEGLGSKNLFHVIHSAVDNFISILSVLLHTLMRQWFKGTTKASTSDFPSSKCTVWCGSAAFVFMQLVNILITFLTVVQSATESWTD